MSTPENATQLPSDGELKRLASLCQQQLALEKQVETLEEALKHTQGQLQHVQEIDIPELLTSLGISQLKLADGSKVEVKEFYNAGISAEHQEAAFTWLREQGLDSIIKREIKLNFGKGEDSKANLLYKNLVSAGYNPADKSSVHHATLKSFVKERVEGGQPLPMDLFGVFIGKRTKITPAK
jgi:hypothetical protein